MRLAAVLALALALVPAARAGTSTTVPTPQVPAAESQRSTSGEVIQNFLAYPKVAAWLKRYPPNPVTEATFAQGVWTVGVWSGKAGEIATGKVDDATASVTEAWTGPQVAWKMARGYKGAFGGAKINSAWVWLSFCGLFLVGLIDWRRLLSVRNVDLLVLVSFTVSLWYFNRGNVFAAMPLAYPPLVWLLVRCVWIARSDRPSRGAPVWPVWVLAAATVFVAGFRVGLNVRASNVIDVGYSGVIGADRIAHGQSPYGHFPVEDDRPKCGPADADGEVRDRIQTNGRCENANPYGDTYGPVSYIAYLPGYAIFGWSGQWDSLPAVHFTSILFDLLAIVGLALVGRRFGGPRLAATLAFAWVAWPFTQYASSSNTNDAIAPALLIWGFLALTTPVARGAAVAVSGWTKFASLLLLPLWLGYPEARRGRALARARVRRHDRARLLRPLPRAVPVARRSRLLRPHRRLPDRPRLAVLALGLGAVPRQGPAQPADRAAGPRGAARRRLARARLGAAAAVAAAHGRAHGSRARRLRARPDALVLPLPAVVLPVRRAGADRAAPGRRAGTGRRKGRGR